MGRPASSDISADAIADIIMKHIDQPDFMCEPGAPGLVATRPLWKDMKAYSTHFSYKKNPLGGIPEGC